MAVSEVETRSKSDACGATHVLVNTFLSKGSEHSRSLGLIFYAETETSSSASHILDPFGEFLCHVVKPLSELSASLNSVLKEVVSLNHVVLVDSEHGSNGISHPGVVMAHDSLHRSLFGVIETSGLHLLSEGHEVGRRVEIPLFMSPEGSRGDHSSLNFINHHVDASVLGQLSDAIGKVARDLEVTTFSHNRFDGKANDLDALLLLPLVNHEFNSSERLIVLLAVVLCVIFKRVLVDRRISCGPVKGRHVNFVYRLGS